VGQHITHCEACRNAWRVLGVDGRPRPNFSWSDPGETRTCREVLESEGVEFKGSGPAHNESKVDGAQLAARL
jgi:predicted nucleic acid-binding Zn ribbon protein